EEAALSAALAGLVRREFRLVDVLRVRLIAQRLGERVTLGKMRQALARGPGGGRLEPHQCCRCRYGGSREEGAARGIRIVLGQGHEHLRTGLTERPVSAKRPRTGKFPVTRPVRQGRAAWAFSGSEHCFEAPYLWPMSSPASMRTCTCTRATTLMTCCRMPTKIWLPRAPRRIVARASPASSCSPSARRMTASARCGRWPGDNRRAT